MFTPQGWGIMRGYGPDTAWFKGPACNFPSVIKG